MKAVRAVRRLLVLWLCAGVACAGDYREHAQAQAFVDDVVARHDLDRNWVQEVIAGAEYKQSIIDAISRPAEKALEWKQYRKIFLQPERVRGGVAFWQQHRDALARAERQYRVPAEIIVAIIGVETKFGRIMGNYRVIDALATLAFDYPPRSPFFAGQLEQYLLLVREQRFDPFALKGSYAGAMGYGQFIPGSYRHFAVDFDGDGVADILDNPVDAIGSVANYFAEHGWQHGAPVVERAVRLRAADESLINDSLKPAHTLGQLQRAGYAPRNRLPATLQANVVLLQGDLGEEYWIGLHNFYVITRYNHSRLYAMAVWQLSQQIRDQEGQ